MLPPARLLKPLLLQCRDGPNLSSVSNERIHAILTIDRPHLQQRVLGRRKKHAVLLDEEDACHHIAVSLQATDARLSNEVPEDNRAIVGPRR